MRLIDAHQHYWRIARMDYSWLTPQQGALYRDFLPAELAQPLAECGIGATVLVQAAATEAETRYLFALARANPNVAGVVGWVDFEALDARQRLRALVQDGEGRLKGLRPMVQDLPDPLWLERPTIDAAFDALIASDLCFDALVRPQHLPSLACRLQRHPQLRAVLDHAGKPDIAGGGFDAWADPIARLARGSGLYCKLSGLLNEAAPEADLEALDGFVAHLFECFGPERILWGSDWPVLSLRGSYRQWWEMAHALVQRHAPGQQSAVFGANAARFYRL